MSENIGIDIGYGYTKICNKNGNYKFPSTVSKATPLQFELSEIISVAINGSEHDFFVGEIALRERTYMLDIRNRNFILSPAWLALLAKAIHASYYSNNGNLVLGVPPGHYTKALASEIETKVSTINFKIINELVTEKKVAFKKVKVVPQGAGIYFDYVFDTRQIDKNILIADLGFQTLDVVFFERNKYVESVASSWDTGVSSMFERIANYIYTAHKMSASLQDVESLFLKKEKKVNNVDITDILEKEKRGYAEAVRQKIENIIYELGIRVDQIVIAGGGAELLKNVDCFRIKNCYFPPECDFANARGYYKYAQII